MAEIVGSAQGPKLKWTPNADGPRTIEQAVEIARRYGVAIPDDVEFFVDEGMLEPNTYARYCGFLKYPGDYVYWTELYHDQGYIPVLIREDVLKSDEAIVAIFVHEMHELNRLREIFGANRRRRLPFEYVDELIRPGTKRNLHCEAWDLADAAVLRMRGGERCE